VTSSRAAGALGLAAVLAVAALPGPHRSSAEGPSPRPRAAVLLFPGVQIIDYTGPYEVLGQGGFEVFTVAAEKGPLRTAMGMTVTPAYTLQDAPPADVLVVPGGGVDAALESAPTLEWVRTRSAHARFTLSVCNGAFILARAGLLDGLQATTFHRMLDELAQDAPKVRVVRDRRFVDNGRIITAAGLSSGIDGALHVLERVHGRGRAQEVALNLEYDWRPDSGWARAALADRMVPRLRVDGIDVAETLSTEGDRLRWTRRLRLRSPLALPEVRRRAETAFSDAGWTQDGGGGHWIRRDGNGTAWRGGVSIETGAATGEFVAQVAVQQVL
jgi:putative intracellular protease/amidase